MHEYEVKKKFNYINRVEKNFIYKNGLLLKRHRNVLRCTKHLYGFLCIWQTKYGFNTWEQETRFMFSYAKTMFGYHVVVTCIKHHIGVLCTLKYLSAVLKIIHFSK